MECFNCGGALNAASVGRVVKCPFCGTSSAWMPTTSARNSEGQPLKPEIERLLTSASRDIEAKRYESAVETLNKVLDIDVDCWQAYANMAIAQFWLGTTDYLHLGTVQELLQKAAESSNNGEFIAATTRAVSFNIACLVNAQDPVGHRLEQSVSALQSSMNLVDDFEERDAIISEYAQRQAGRAANRLISVLARDKKDFDPPRSELLLLGHLLLLSKTLPVEPSKVFLASANYKSRRKLDPDIQSLAAQVAQKYVVSSKANEVPTVQFPMFGAPKII